ncbi:MAG TPA: hypothetical protein VGH23_01465 [Rhizomicrobium sp.]|jgi:hypothetical protein
MFTQWIKLSSDVMLANFEAQHVIGLRLAKLARGGVAAEVESRRMVTEKLAAAAEAATALAMGKSPNAIVRRYRTIIRANKRRLSGR